MSSYTITATDLFEVDLDEAVSYYLQMAGPNSAASLLDDYDTMCRLLKTLPVLWLERVRNTIPMAPT